MTLMDQRHPAPPPTADAWPAEVDLIISALAAGEDRAKDARSRGFHGREAPRLPYRVLADLRLYSDPGDADAWRLYTRDVSTRGLGFITCHRLPLGYGGTIELAAPHGQVIAVNCTLLRCREIASGWFDGAVYFNREQPAFAPR
ncbi:MAG TPA: PilZ domain-containing protein [Tepidisphaeraceae bacterium]|nr:PilZ domain-containing protein [Tepidisphaeraceae bacterium]